jgi:hypothetical protein
LPLAAASRPLAASTPLPESAWSASPAHAEQYANASAMRLMEDSDVV